MAQPCVYPVLSAEELHSLCKPSCLYVLSFQVICKDWSNLAGKNYIILNMSDNIDCVSQSAEICWHGRNGAEVWRQAQLPLCAFTTKHFKSTNSQNPYRGCGEKDKNIPVLQMGKEWVDFTQSRPCQFQIGF